ncbi:MAG: hypothetical protein ACOC44_01605 [Promethearchaeia archaeon]
MRRRRLKSSSNTESKLKEKFRAVLDDNTALSVYNRKGKSLFIIRKNLATYDIEVSASEAPLLNKSLDSPEPYESSMGDIQILEEEIFPINEAIKAVFGNRNDLELYQIKLGVGANKNNYVTVDDRDLKKYEVEPTLTGLMKFIKENRESILGFLDRKYISEEGNVIYLSCGKKNPSDNIRSIKLKILASMQQRGYFLQQDHKYYGLQLYLIIDAKETEDSNIFKLLKELEVDWEIIFFRRQLAIDDWTEIECEKDSENLKAYLRAKYENLNYFDINNITRLVVKNQLAFNVADKMASLLYRMKVERSSEYKEKEGHSVPFGDGQQYQEDVYSVTLKKAEIAAAAQLACAYLGNEKEIKFDSDVKMNEILKYQEELTNI